MPSAIPRGPLMGQPFDQMLGMPPIAGDVIRLVVHGTATWLGFFMGRKETGVLSAVGYAFGGLNAMGAFFDVVAVVEELFS